MDVKAHGFHINVICKVRPSGGEAFEPLQASSPANAGLFRGVCSGQIQHAAIANAVAPDTHAARRWLKIVQRLGDEETQVFQRGLAQAWNLIQKVMVEPIAQLLQPCTQLAKVDDHAIVRIARASHADFGVVGVAVNAAAALGFDSALQRVGRIEEKTLVNGELHISDR